MYKIDQQLQNTNHTNSVEVDAFKLLESENELNFSDLSNNESDDIDFKLQDDLRANLNSLKIENEYLMKSNCKLKEENTKLKSSFEAEKFSINFIYGAKIDSLEKELQQVLYENH